MLPPTMRSPFLVPVGLLLSQRVLGLVNNGGWKVGLGHEEQKRRAASKVGMKRREPDDLLASHDAVFKFRARKEE